MQYHSNGKPYHILTLAIGSGVKHDNFERRMMDSAPMKRSKDIRHMGCGEYVYPDAVHRRFSHSVAVMRWAGRIFFEITKLENIPDKADYQAIREMEEIKNPEKRDYWLRTVRMAGLLHDVGHAPYSHATERLFPKGWNHERMTIEIILNHPEVRSIIEEAGLDPEIVAKVAVGEKDWEEYKGHEEKFSSIEKIATEVVTGDIFGADRIEYLLRDAQFTGVKFGVIDQEQLINGIRIVPWGENHEPTLGIKIENIDAAKALLSARANMYSSVFSHPIIQSYEMILSEYLEKHLKGGVLPTDIHEFLKLSDSIIDSAMRVAAFDAKHPLQAEAAKMVVGRQHYRVLKGGDKKIAPSMKVVWKAACEKFGEEKVKFTHFRKAGGAKIFPVRMRDGSIRPSSDFLTPLEPIEKPFIFVAPEILSEARQWLETEAPKIRESKSLIPPGFVKSPATIFKELGITVSSKTSKDSHKQCELFPDLRK